MRARAYTVTRRAEAVVATIVLGNRSQASSPAVLFGVLTHEWIFHVRSGTVGFAAPGGHTVDADAHPRLARFHGVRTIPDVLFLNRDHVVVDRLQTFEPAKALLPRLDELLKAPDPSRTRRRAAASEARLSRSELLWWATLDSNQ